MINIIFIGCLMGMLISGIRIVDNILSREHKINLIFSNRLENLKNIITEKDITYKARIEELNYIWRSIK